MKVLYLLLPAYKSRLPTLALRMKILEISDRNIQFILHEVPNSFPQQYTSKIMAMNSTIRLSAKVSTKVNSQLHVTYDATDKQRRSLAPAATCPRLEWSVGDVALTDRSRFSTTSSPRCKCQLWPLDVVTSGKNTRLKSGGRRICITKTRVIVVRSTTKGRVVGTAPTQLNHVAVLT